MSSEKMPARDRVRAAIEDLIVEFAWRIDHDNGYGAEDLFTEDGVYAMGPAVLSGRAEIVEFYRRRRAAGPRTSRHLFTNLRFHSIGDDRAEATCVLSLHGADGQPPHPLSPVLIADYHDQYSWNGQRWLFARRDVDLVFGAVPHVIQGES